jgi:hypothetical protein
MRRIRTIMAALVALGALAGGAVYLWRRNPRMGSGFVNTVVNPGMIRRGLAGRGSSELGTLEHIGRRTGIRRLTLVHPEPTSDGFRIMVPLGSESQWARNVLAAGHCRLQLHDLVCELDEPTMVPASEIEGLPRVLRRVEGALGFEYLLLRQFAVAPGALEATETEASPRREPDQSEETTSITATEVASSAT